MLSSASLPIAGVTIATVLAGCTSAVAQDCRPLAGTHYRQGELYAVSVRNGTRNVVRLDPDRQQNDLYFDPNVTLIYVLDGPPNAPSRVTRDFAGVFAVRLVSKGADRKGHRPTYVLVKRDAVSRRRGARQPMAGEVSAARYYNYHNPRAVRASDSYLEREFHTDYTYREGEADRQTYDPRQRRSQFHFPEMRPTDPTDAASRLIANFFGSGEALADVPESRFEAQIKYYPRIQNVAPQRCITVTTRLANVDNDSLKITMIDLDFPDGLDAFGSSRTWNIAWKKPPKSR